TFTFPMWASSAASRATPITLAALVAAACAPAPKSANSAVEPSPLKVDTQIISLRVDGSARELLAKGERALLAQAWEEAIDTFETLLASDPDETTRVTVLYDLAAAYEGAGMREKARDRYHELATRYPQSANARGALQHVAFLHAQLEEWDHLEKTAAE